MISGGNTTIYVSDMAVSVQFYSEKLGLRLLARAGDGWALLDAGSGVMVALNEATPAAPRPGTSGAITLGLQVNQPLEKAMEALSRRGVWFRTGVIEDTIARRAYFGDPDGNDLFLFELNSR